VFLGEVSHVSCETQKRNARVKAEDTATMMLRHASGAVSVVEYTYESRKQPDCFPQTLGEIEGSLGAFVMGPDSRIQVSCSGDVTEETLHEDMLVWMEKRCQVVQTSVLNANAHFLSRLKQGNAADTDIIDNLKTFAIVEAAHSAAKSGKACQPPQYRF
jgi:predicted dehydrogenase